MVQIYMCFGDGEIRILHTEQTLFSSGQKIVIENGPMFEIEDVQYQFRENEIGLIHICTNLIIKEEVPMGSEVS